MFPRPLPRPLEIFACLIKEKIQYLSQVSGGEEKGSAPVRVVDDDELGQVPGAARLLTHWTAGQLTAGQLACGLAHHVHGARR